MDFTELVLKNRSYRRFDGSYRIEERTLKELVGLARITPSSANKQPLKFVLSCSPDWNARIFDTVSWAGYISDWPGPEESERPTAYIVVLFDTALQIAADIDVGIASQTILLGAVRMGLGGCMLGSVKKDALAKLLSLHAKLKVSLVIALGKPVEKIVLEDMAADGSVKYYRDASLTHHVPKRKIEELILASYS
jgi:nitroreductase